MKLLTEMSDFGHGDAMIVYDGDATHRLTCEQQLEHDAAYAHALVRAMEEIEGSYADCAPSKDIKQFLTERAAELMREWGFEETP